MKILFEFDTDNEADAEMLEWFQREQKKAKKRKEGIR